MYSSAMAAYNQALHEAQAELARLEERRAVLLRLIQNLKELSPNELYELTPPPGYVPKGLTEEIRTIMALTTIHLDAMQIRDSLITRGFEYSTPKNLLINVHTVLGRIENELDKSERDGKAVYRAKSNDYVAINGEKFFERLAKAHPLAGVNTLRVPSPPNSKDKK